VRVKKIVKCPATGEAVFSGSIIKRGEARRFLEDVLGILVAAGNAETKAISVPAVLIQQTNESVRIARLGCGHDRLLVV
jgi:hypothetical protein